MFVNKKKSMDHLPNDLVFFVLPSITAKIVPIFSSFRLLPLISKSTCNYHPQKNITNKHCCHNTRPSDDSRIDRFSVVHVLHWRIRTACVGYRSLCLPFVVCIAINAYFWFVTFYNSGFGCCFEYIRVFLTAFPHVLFVCCSFVCI